jgi:hypothetical protein
MTNIMLRLFYLEIKNKQIIGKKNEKSIKKFQGVLKKKQKLKVKLQVNKHENNEILVELQIARKNINNMGKHNKNLGKIII